LLTISELESGGVKLSLQSVPLRPLSEKVLADFRERAAARRMELSAQVPDLIARADPDRIEQVLCNLVDNAIKYGRDEGKVCVAARVAEAGWIEVSVRDDGPGIPPASLERVFERFYRVDKARSREQGGTGLGLSIVKHIVKNHGGRVWAESQPGQGAAFFFTLPQDPGSPVGLAS
jgi:two-component system phosphate regulon sensor histidine kinase PhoR